MKRIILALFIILTLTGCKKERTDRVVVTFWHAMGGPLGRALDQLIDEFNSMQDSIYVNSISMGNYNALSQKIMASILARKTPTIAQVYESWTTSLARSGAIQPIEDFVKKDSAFKNQLEDFFPVFIRDNTYDSVLYTLPFNKSVTAYFYNVDMFKKKGIDRFPETYTELIEVSRKLTSGDTLATAFSVTVGMFEQLLYAFGGRLLDENGNPVFDSEEGIKALKYLQDMLYKYHVAHLTTGYQHQDEFLAGRVAYVMGTSVSYAFIMRQKPTFTLGMAPMPHEVRKVCFIMGTNIAIFRRAREKEKRAAWTFIKWFTSPEIQARWALATGYVPVRRSAVNLPEVQKRFKEVPGLEDVWAQLDYAITEPVLPGWYIGRKLLSQLSLEPALRGGMDVEEVLRRGKLEVARALKQD